MKIKWRGKGLKEKCYVGEKCVIEISKRYFRPLEVDSLLGDFRKASKKLKWKPKHNLKSLVKDMIDEALKN